MSAEQAPEPVICGTYRGYSRHLKKGEPACRPCRGAASAYMKAYRLSRPEKYRKEKRRRAARDRALVRLARRYPGVLRRLLDEELGREAS